MTMEWWMLAWGTKYCMRHLRYLGRVWKSGEVDFFYFISRSPTLNDSMRRLEKVDSTPLRLYESYLVPHSHLKQTVFESVLGACSTRYSDMAMLFCPKGIARAWLGGWLMCRWTARVIVILWNVLYIWCCIIDSTDKRMKCMQTMMDEQQILSRDQHSNAKQTVGRSGMENRHPWPSGVHQKSWSHLSSRYLHFHSGWSEPPSHPFHPRGLGESLPKWLACSELSPMDRSTRHFFPTQSS